DAHVRSLEECLTIRTDAKAWAAALDTVLSAAADGFTSRQGRLLDSSGVVPVFESLVDVPGTYDCEGADHSLRCPLFSGRTSGKAAARYHRLVKIFRSWLPSTWTSTEHLEDGGTDRKFLARDEVHGTVITLACAGTRVYLVVQRGPV